MDEQSKSKPKEGMKLITKIKENDANDKVIQERQQMVSTMTPGQLGSVRGFGDIPIPTLFKKRSRSISETREKKIK